MIYPVIGFLLGFLVASVSCVVGLLTAIYLSMPREIYNEPELEDDKSPSKPDIEKPKTISMVIKRQPKDPIDELLKS